MAVMFNGIHQSTTLVIEEQSTEYDVVSSNTFGNVELIQLGEGWLLFPLEFLSTFYTSAEPIQYFYWYESSVRTFQTEIEK